MIFNFTLSPAYGRDYKSKAEVQADLDANKDFIVESGRRVPINKPQLLEAGATSVFIRYSGLRKVGGFSLTGE